MASVALQLYTVRDECDRDLEGTLRRLGAQGYDGVELFDLHGHEPGAVRAWLDEAGLVAAGRHARLEAIEDELQPLSAELAALGTDRMAISWIDPDWLDEPAALVRRIEAAARRGSTGGAQARVPQPLERAASRSTAAATFLDLLRELPPTCSGSSSTSAGSGRPAPTRSRSSSGRPAAARSSTSRTTRAARAATTSRSATGSSATSSVLPAAVERGRRMARRRGGRGRRRSVHRGRPLAARRAPDHRCMTAPMRRRRRRLRDHRGALRRGLGRVRALAAGRLRRSRHRAARSVRGRARIAAAVRRRR